MGAILYYMDRSFPELNLLGDTFLLVGLFVGVFLMGIIITWLSTYFATQRFLNLKTDELYLSARWMAMATGKSGRCPASSSATTSAAGRPSVAVAVTGPIALFVAAGFEHSIANMYFFPLATLLQAFEAQFEGASARDRAGREALHQEPDHDPSRESTPKKNSSIRSRTRRWSSRRRRAWTRASR